MSASPILVQITEMVLQATDTGVIHFQYELAMALPCRISIRTQTSPGHPTKGNLLTH